MAPVTDVVAGFHKLHRTGNQIREIKSRSLLLFGFISLEDILDGHLVGLVSILHVTDMEIYLCLLVFRPAAVFLCIKNPARRYTCKPCRGLALEFERRLHEMGGVGIVGYGESLRKTYPVPETTEKQDSKGMERPHRRTAPCLGHKSLKTLPHLSCSLVGEGDRTYFVRLHQPL